MNLFELHCNQCLKKIPDPVRIGTRDSDNAALPADPHSISFGSHSAIPKMLPLVLSLALPAERSP